MTTLYVSADSLKPSNHAIEQAYSYGSDGITYGPPVLMDAAGDGEQVSLLPASNTRVTFVYEGAVYRLLNRQQTFGTVLVKSIDSGATWVVLDAAGSPLFQTCSGYFDLATAAVYCVYMDANPGPGNLRLITFNLITGLWGVAYGAVGPAIGGSMSGVTIYRRPDGSLLVLYSARPVVTASGLAASVYDPIGNTWGAAFDVGANITGLTGWDAAQTSSSVVTSRSVMDDGGTVHCVFGTSSLQTVPVIWGNRVFYQQILSDDSTPIGGFFDFPGQTSPFPPFPYNRQQLEAYTGPPYGNPIIVGDNILLPVCVRNDSLADRFPIYLPNIYVGAAVAAPVWTLDAAGSIDPDVFIDDFIWIQQAPSITYDGTTIFAVYSAQDEDGQNLARLRMCQTSTPNAPTTGWTATTIFDLQIDAPPGFNFVDQFLSGAGAFSPVALVEAPTFFYLNQLQLFPVLLPDPSMECKR